MGYPYVSEYDGTRERRGRLSRLERPRINASGRPREEGKPVIRGARHDMSGNIVGGTYAEDTAVAGPNDKDGNPTQVIIKAGTRYDSAPPTTLERGPQTPRLDAFAGRQRPEAAAPTFDDATKQLMTDPKKNWGQLSWEARTEAYRRDQGAVNEARKSGNPMSASVPVPGRTAAMDARLDAARQNVLRENVARNQERAANVAARSAFDRSDPTRVTMKPVAQAAIQADLNKMSEDRLAEERKKKQPTSPV